MCVSVCILSNSTIIFCFCQIRPHTVEFTFICQVTRLKLMEWRGKGIHSTHEEAELGFMELL